MLPLGEQGHHASPFLVHFYLRGDDIGKNRQFLFIPPHHRNAGFVARGFNAEDNHNERNTIYVLFVISMI